MSLPAGSKLGPYEILAPIGAGGMGAVYRARDPRMGRDVAVKVSAERFSDRLSREVHAVAALNHPNICHIYDVGSEYFVMELVDGPTLAETIRHGALPLPEALRIARQVGDALEAAHEKGIVHRDLKPGNIILRKDGTAKVLDFGLAKVEESNPAGERSHSQSLTVDPVSRAGVVVGTAAYMAPEQVRGKFVDKRADIWAFGVILFEMLTGERLFDAGETVSDTLIEVATREPPWEHIPVQARPLLRRCLEKDPSRRLRDLGDAWAWLEDGPEDVVPKGKEGRWRLPVTLVTGAALIAAAFAVGHFTRTPQHAGAIRFSFAPPFKSNAIGPVVSPDGTRIASSDVFGVGSVWLSSIDSSSARKLQGTEGAQSLFWSPDGRSLGFVSDNRMQRLDLISPENPPRILASPANGTAGAAWSSRGIIVFQTLQAGSGLSRVPEAGGPPATATRLNASRREIVHRYPQFLPDGRHFIYWVWSALEENTGEYIGSIDPTEKLAEGPLVRTWREAHYADPGYLLYMEGAVLVARPFDPSGLRFTGEPRALPERIGRNWETTGRAMFSTSASGSLVYQEALPQPEIRIALRGLNGDLLRTIGAPPGTRWTALDPQGTHIAVQGLDENTVEDLWIVDLDRGVSSRLTARQGSNEQPIWSPDGRRIAFTSNRAGAYDLYAKNADGAGQDELLLRSPQTKWPVCWSADGKFLVYTESDRSNIRQTWVLPLEGDRTPIPFLSGAFNTSDSRLSPAPDNQGRFWMAYSSDETGSTEVYLRSFLPGAPAGSAGAVVRVSPNGGRYPIWRKDARQLFYSAGSSQEMAVDVKLGNVPEIGMPHALFHTNYPAVSVDGRRFLTIEPAGESPAPRISVVLNWAAELTAK